MLARKSILLLAAVLLCGLPGWCAESGDAAAKDTYNINSDLSNWSFGSVTDGENGFKISVDKDVIFDGKPAAFVESTKGEQKADKFYAVPCQHFRAKDYLGKRIEFAANLKSSEVKGAAGLIVKAMKQDKVVAFDDMEESPVTGSNDWKKYSVAINVPQDADICEIGVYLAGGGKVWFGGLSVTAGAQDLSAKTKVWDHKKCWRFDHSLRMEPDDLDLSQVGKHPETDAMLNWTMHTSESPGNGGLDRKVMFNGKPSAVIWQNANDPTDFVSSYQDISAAHYVGKRIRLSGFLKTKGVTDWSGLWMRIDGGNMVLAFDNMEDRPVKGNTDFSQKQIVLDVPESATRIRLGFMQAGSGKSWLNSCTLTSVDDTVPVTAKSISPAHVPNDVQNKSPDLQFETK